MSRRFYRQQEPKASIVKYSPNTLSTYSKQKSLKITVQNASQSYSLYGYKAQSWTEPPYTVRQQTIIYNGTEYDRYALALSNTMEIREISK